MALPYSPAAPAQAHTVQQSMGLASAATIHLHFHQAGMIVTSDMQSDSHAVRQTDAQTPFCVSPVAAK